MRIIGSGKEDRKLTVDVCSGECVLVSVFCGMYVIGFVKCGCSEAEWLQLI